MPIWQERRQKIKPSEKIVFERSRNDPCWFVENILNDKLWSKQAEILEAVRDNDEIAIKACHGPGKSFTAARIALWFLYTHSPSMVLTTAPTDRQVKGIIWKEIRMAHAQARLPLGGDMLTQELKLGPGWFAAGFTAPDYDSDRFQGFHEDYILVIVDEAAGVSDQIFEAIDGILTSQNAKLVIIGNPTNPSGRFARSFKTTGVKKLSISAFQTPNFTKFGITEQDIADDTYDQKIAGRELPYPKLVTPQWVRKRYLRWGPESPIYKARVKAIFPEEGEDTLIPLAWIEAAKNRTIEPSNPNELGVDVARFGSDDTIIAHRQGDVAKIISKSSKEDTMQTTGRVVLTMRETQAKSVKVDVIGVGAGVVDRLTEIGEPVIAYNSARAPKNTELYLNARAEDYWSLRMRFEQGKISLPGCSEDLENQLASIRYTFNSRARIQIESKDEMKKRNMQSPDEADALNIAFSDQADIEPEIRAL